MRRVVVTGLGIVSSIGNKPQEVTAIAAPGKIRHRRGRRLCATWAFAARCRRLKIDLDAVVDRRARRFRATARPMLAGDEPGHRRCRA